MSTLTVLQRFILQSALLLTFCSALTYACYGQLLVSGINAEEKKIILQEHNRLRQMVATGRYPGQPGAENMREIVWDDELAARAQKWADNCQFRHDPHRTINRFTMGQNLAIIWSTAPLDPNDGDFPSRIQSWFNEVQKYSFGDAWSPKTGHYSQLVWGETSLVGCGYSEYKDTSKYNKLWVCNYGPGGNVVGYNPYEAGKPSCKTYGMRPSQRYNGLCAAPRLDGNGIDSNTIETYEYTNTQTTNTFNNKQTSTQIVQQVPSSSYPQQATSFYAKAQAHTAASVQTAGSSYGAAGYGGSAKYTTEASQLQQNQYNKYRNKLESYKPTPQEFEKSVQKHTILRSFLNDAAAKQQQLQLVQQEHDVQPQEPQSQPQEGVYFVEEAPQVSTQKPAKRGWSLLTWQG